jgi:hypothetical protein
MNVTGTTATIGAGVTDIVADRSSKVGDRVSQQGPGASLYRALCLLIVRSLRSSVR